MSGNDFVSIVFIAVGLAADCFAVALGAGVSGRSHSRLSVLRVAFFFGLFQGLMPVLGWLAGRTVVDFIAVYDHWIAFILLTIVAGRMLWEAFHPGRDEDRDVDVTRGWMLLTMSVATSIDALAVGLSFAFLDVNMFVAAPTIGAVAFAFTVLGFVLGKKAGRLIGRQAKVVGALILLAIAFRILLTHFFA